MKYISSILVIVLFCIQGIASLTIAQEKTVQSSEQQQEAPSDVQTEEMNIPVITNPVVFNEKDLYRNKDILLIQFLHLKKN